MKKLLFIFAAALLVLFGAGCKKNVKITFETNGGEAIAPVTLKQKTVYTAPIPIKTGSTFQGWFTDLKLETPFENAKPVVRNLKLYAKWELNTYQLTLQPNNGAAETQLSFHYDEAVSTLQLTQPTKEGYSFQGWFLDPEFTEPFALATLPDHDLTLFAQWQKREYTVLITQTFGTLLADETFEPYPKQPDLVTTLEKVSYGEAINFVGTEDPTGYTRHAYQINGGKWRTDWETVYEAKGDSSELQIVVRYKRNKLTLTFLEDKDVIAPGAENPRIFEVHYGDDFDVAGQVGNPAVKPDAGIIDARWAWRKLENIHEDLFIGVFYYRQGEKAVTFYDGNAILHVAYAKGEDVILTGDSLIWQRSRAGYRFLGWYTLDAVNESQKVALDSDGNLKFSQFTDEHTFLYAQYEKLPAFAQPQITELRQLADDGYSIDFTIASLTVADQAAKELRIKVAGREAAVPVTGITAQGEGYRIIIDPQALPDAHSVLAQVAVPGRHEVYLRFIGDELNHVSGAWSPAFVVNNITDIGDVTGAQAFDYHIVEDVTVGSETHQRYIFYAEKEYHFPETEVIEVVSGEAGAFVSKEKKNVLFTSTKLGAFEFTRTKADGTKTHYYGKIVADITQFAWGISTLNYLTEKAGTSFLRPDVTPYLVGTQNDFYFDINALNAKGEALTLAKLELVYEFRLAGTTEILSGAALAELVEIKEDNTFRFKEAASGKTLSVTLRPQYQANLMQVADLSFEFTVREAMNAFTNSELKKLFANMSVQEIIVHRNIVAKLDPEQLNPDGSPINYYVYDKEPNPYGSVYGRMSFTHQGDRCVVHGNYMTINGADLPKINAKSSPDGSYTTVSYTSAFPIYSVQVGIFYYNVGRTGHPDIVNDNRVLIKDLKIIGNTTTPELNYQGLSQSEIKAQELLMSENSGGMWGFVTRAGSAKLENVVINYSLSAMVTTQSEWLDAEKTQPGYLHADYVATNNSWANSIWTWRGALLKVTNSYFGRSGGPAIQLCDTLHQTGGVYDPQLEINAGTVIDNWVTGSEAWFKAYSLDVMTLSLKSGVNNALAQIGKSIIQVKNNPVTNMAGEMFNFAILSEGKTAAYREEGGQQTAGSQAKVTIAGGNGAHAVYRAFNLLATDPRVQDGTFLFPVSQYSELAAFGGGVAQVKQAFQDKYSQAITDQQAGQFMFAAAAYNLTPAEVADAYGLVAGGKAWPEAVKTVKGADHPHAGFVEVVVGLNLAGAGNKQGNSAIFISLVD